MSFLSDKTLQGLRDGVVERLVFTTPYQLLRLDENGALDSRGNPLSGGAAGDWHEVESGECGVIRGGATPQEQVIFARLGTVVPYTLKMPIDSVVRASDRVQLDGMVLDVVGVARNPAVPLWLLVTADEVK